MTGAILVTFFALALLGMPFAFALGLSSVVALSVSNIDYSMLPQKMMYAVNAFPLLAIPFFMIAGETMVRAGIMDRLFDLANAFVGRVRGGTAHVAVGAGAAMASVSGTAVADASALASTLIRPLSKSYGIGFSAAVVAAAANLGPIIPPSTAMIVYAYMAGGSVSIAALFMAGVVPGLLITVGLLLLCSVIAWKRGYPLAENSFSLRNAFFQLRRSFIILLMPVIVIGGIVSGAFTATEGSAIAVIMAFLIGFFVTRRLRIADLPGIFVSAMITTAMVGAMIAFASTVTFVLTVDMLPFRMAEFAKTATQDPLVFLLVVAVLLVIVGMFLESNAAFIMLVPLMHPIAVTMGIDPVFFAFIFVLNLMIGMLTPPVGIVLFVITGVARISIGEIVRNIWPFIILNYAVLLACIFFPKIVLWLPQVTGLIR